ncbi:hypothetical protein EVAR_64735_1 [Eumeta japonica]|uniref:Uncharacterized protein n=1 Tax=Eumeta variegata TaxID=151549 RepID=A0A4C1Z997_EUMVA|nr:hypothetical protein EVAR_64735_1 [Eumeta japonica]
MDKLSRCTASVKMVGRDAISRAALNKSTNGPRRTFPQAAVRQRSFTTYVRARVRRARRRPATLADAAALRLRFATVKQGRTQGGGNVRHLSHPGPMILAHEEGSGSMK